MLFFQSEEPLAFKEQFNLFLQPRSLRSLPCQGIQNTYWKLQPQLLSIAFHPRAMILLQTQWVYLCEFIYGSLSLRGCLSTICICSQNFMGVLQQMGSPGRGGCTNEAIILKWVTATTVLIKKRRALLMVLSYLMLTSRGQTAPLRGKRSNISQTQKSLAL